MTREQFDKELKLLQEQIDSLYRDIGIQPTKEFCEFFLDNQASDEECEEAGYYDDHMDYHSWGAAIHNDIHQSGEEVTYELNLWDWVDRYNLLN